MAKPKKPGGGGDGGDGTPGKPSQKHGNIDASKGITSAQDTTAEVAQAGRPSGGDHPALPGTPDSTGGTKPTGQPGGTPEGPQTRVNPKDDAVTQRAHRMENEAAATLANAGYKVKQNPGPPGSRNPNSKPDYHIEGKIFDCISPTSDNPYSIWSNIKNTKIDKGQTDRMIINLHGPDSKVTVEQLQAQFGEHKIENLKEVKVITQDGKIVDLDLP
jgi:Contact-dependent growth inhibition CdiA C-terminal domain